MAIQIICNVIMFINLAVATGLLVYEFIVFPLWISSIETPADLTGEDALRYLFNRYAYKMFKVLASMIIPMAISITTCLLDGLTGITGGENELYIIIPFAIVIFGIVPLTVAFSLRFRFARGKYEVVLPSGQMSGGEPAFAIFISITYLVIVAQAIYTIVLLCVL